MGRLRPSAAGIWGHCAASVAMQEIHPDTGDDNASMIGTAAHWLASEILDQYTRSSGVALAFDYLGKFAPNGILIDDHIVDSVDAYIDVVLKVCQKNGLLQKMQIEKHILINRISRNFGGTPDLWIFDDVNKILHVFDFKNGFSIVDVFECYQLICYAVGILDKLTDGNALAMDDIKIVFHIVQPLAFHPDGIDRTWIANPSDLRGIVNILTDKAAESLSDHPSAASGNHCKHCSGIAHCHTAAAASVNAVDLIESMNDETIPNDQLALSREILNRALSAVKDRLNGLESEIETKLIAGQTVDGLTLTTKAGRLKWTKPDQEIIMLSALMGSDLTKIVCCTPTQAKKKLDASLIDAYSERSIGKKIIVNSDTTKAALIFGKKR